MNTVEHHWTQQEIAERMGYKHKDSIKKIIEGIKRRIPFHTLHSDFKAGKTEEELK